MEGEREADGDEGLGRVAKPLRGEKKDKNPLDSLCRETGNQGGGQRGGGKQGDGNSSW